MPSTTSAALASPLTQLQRGAAHFPAAFHHSLPRGAGWVEGEAQARYLHMRGSKSGGVWGTEASRGFQGVRKGGEHAGLAAQRAHARNT